MRVTKEDLLKENDELRGRLFEAQTELIRQRDKLIAAISAISIAIDHLSRT